MAAKIQNWYANKNLLITGATGFIGKVLIEKILRTCPDIGKVYIFVRPKNGKTSEERKFIIFDNPIFDNLKKLNSNQIDKVQLMNASFSDSGLMINEFDAEDLRQNCNIVFHIAASVQFDIDLREICETNVWGLRHLLDLSKNMRNIVSFVLCSTAFSQYYQIQMEEIHYDPPLEPFVLEKFLNQYNDDVLNPLTLKLLNQYANTYAFTKAIAENLIEEYSEYFPVSIARPSIVTNVAYDPLPGWTEGLHGVNGWFLASLFGVLKVFYGVDTTPRSGVPVDMVANALIVIAWQNGIKSSKIIDFYNVAEDILTSSKNPAWKWSIDAEYAARKYPLDIAAMHFGYMVTKNYPLYKLLEMWYHFIPAIIIDILLILFQRTPMLIRAHRKILHNMQPIEYYAMNAFVFKTKNFYNLSKLLDSEERKTYPMDIEKAMNRDYYINGQLGYRRYLLKQKDENLPRARKIQFYLYLFGRLIYIIIFYFLFKAIYKKLIN